MPEKEAATVYVRGLQRESIEDLRSRVQHFEQLAVDARKVLKAQEAARDTARVGLSHVIRAMAPDMENPELDLSTWTISEKELR